MRLGIGRSLALACAVGAFSTLAAPSQMVTRALSQLRMRNFKGGLLLKNGLQTTCEVALLNVSAGFVAANCLNYTDDRVLDSKVKYGVVIDSGDDGLPTVRSSMELSDIHVHPDYDPDTLANNIAVVQFNKDDDTALHYKSFIYLDVEGRDQQTYVRRTLQRPDGEWRAAGIQNQIDNSPGCAGSSSLYDSNLDFLACTSAKTDSIYSRGCYVPYGTLYVETGVDHKDGVLMGLYSHSIVYGDSLCDDSNWISYYTVLANYVGFAGSVMKDSIPVYTDNTSGLSSDTGLLSMRSADTTTSNGRQMVIGGDVYPALNASRAALEAEDKESSTEGGNVDDDDDADSGGLTTTQKIIIGVIVPAVVILITIGGVIVFNIWKSKRQDHAWDPRGQELHLQSAAYELIASGGAGTGEETTPPPYAAAARTDANGSPKEEEEEQLPQIPADSKGSEVGGGDGKQSR
ncbi:hypothetical protein GGF46_003802 [Coemansia sp. RSA 552]|nr:hypothetical protein GGF46_003802 [Coemansia sp. RSA 552]